MSPLKNPLELPEILARISRFVAVNDAAAGVRVCKAWSDHFASAIWHTIDFDVHTNLHRMDAKVLTKYGHYIRVVKNVKEKNHILVLIGSDASKLKGINITLSPSQEFHALVSDLLRRVNTSFDRIEILQPSWSAAPYFTVESLFPMSSTKATSKLWSLKIQGLTMTRDSFSFLLRNCPSLTTLDIKDSTFVSLYLHNKSYEDKYQHIGVTDLTATFKQVFNADGSEGAPSLLVHFPNLITWEMCGITSPSETAIERLRDEVAQHCPLLKVLWTRDSAPVASSMLVKAFYDLKGIGIENERLSVELVTAILNHQETLESVGTFGSTDDSERVPMVKNDSLGASWIIQSIPRICSRLKSLRFPFYEMNMDDIEKTRWGCHDLEALYIRVQGLDTKEKIDRAIQLWQEERIVIKKGQITGRQELSVIPAGDNSIEARVARHLLKFKKLQWVWLGGKRRVG
ncbi:hypothetical protein BGX34_000768 [Mortierella sp. NVP85]|nr:hypothetical protein BGX34_000768 [Mortierella sp. NVP85]